MSSVHFGFLEIVTDMFSIYSQVPIFINKQIVLTDATKIVYGARRRSYSKTAYDVYLDRY